MSKPETFAVGAIFFAVVADALVAAGKYLRAMKQQSEFDFKVDA